MLIAIFFVVVYNVASALCESLVQGGMIASRLKFTSVHGEVAPTLTFGSGNSEVRFCAKDTDGLVIETPTSQLMAFKPDNSIEIGAQELIIKSALNIQGLFRVNNIAQWVLFHQEDFSTGESIGWDNPNPDLVTQCAGINMLGGYGKFAKGEIAKKIAALPPHNQVRVKANFHFIDAWVGETAFMRLNIGKDGSMVYVWTDRHNQNTDAFAVNVCGSGVGEGKFSVPIDVVVNHVSDTITVGFGTTIQQDDPLDQSWGVSALEVYIK